MARRSDTNEAVGTVEAAEAAEKPTEAAPAPAVGTEEEEPAKEGIAVVEAFVACGRGLNLREGPGLNYAVKAVLPDGTALDVMILPAGLEVPGWASAYAGELAGWVAVRFLRTVEG